MKSLWLILTIAAAWLMSGLATQAQPSDPEAFADKLLPLYRISGIRDNGGADNTGVATSVHCTNYSKKMEGLRITVYSEVGTIAADTGKVAVAPRHTFTASTHPTVIFSDSGGQATNYDLATSFIHQGSMVIRGTNTQISCSAMIVDAAASVPNGIALHMVRVTPLEGSEE